MLFRAPVRPRIGIGKNQSTQILLALLDAIAARQLCHQLNNNIDDAASAQMRISGRFARLIRKAPKMQSYARSKILAH